MIVCNGIVGLCLLVGGMRHYEQGFQVQGASAALAVLAALTTLTLILPNVTTSVAGPLFSTSQLVFAGAISLVLYGSFILYKLFDIAITSCRSGVGARRLMRRLRPGRPLL
jgi:Ca2+:H+ antiporter